MDTRPLASACWLIGALAIGAAILVPELRWQFGVKPGMDDLARRVETLAELQDGYHRSTGSFLYFGAGGADQTEAAKTLRADAGKLFGDKWVFDTVSDGGSALVVRGYAAANVVRNGDLPPMMYRFERAVSPDAEPKKTWIAPTPGRRPGLIAPLLAYF